MFLGNADLSELNYFHNFSWHNLGFRIVVAIELWSFSLASQQQILIYSCGFIFLFLIFLFLSFFFPFYSWLFLVHFERNSSGVYNAFLWTVFHRQNISKWENSEPNRHCVLSRAVKESWSQYWGKLWNFFLFFMFLHLHLSFPLKTTIPMVSLNLSLPNTLTIFLYPYFSLLVFFFSMVPSKHSFKLWNPFNIFASYFYLNTTLEFFHYLIDYELSWFCSMLMLSMLYLLLWVLIFICSIYSGFVVNLLDVSMFWYIINVWKEVRGTEEYFALCVCKSKSQSNTDFRSTKNCHHLQSNWGLWRKIFKR